MEHIISIVLHVTIGVTLAALVVAAILMVFKRANGTLESEGCSANSQTKPSVTFIGKKKQPIKGVILRFKGGEVKRVLVGSHKGARRMKVSRFVAA